MANESGKSVRGRMKRKRKRTVLVIELLARLVATDFPSQGSTWHMETRVLLYLSLIPQGHCPLSLSIKNQATQTSIVEVKTVSPRFPSIATATETVVSVKPAISATASVAAGIVVARGPRVKGGIALADGTPPSVRHVEPSDRERQDAPRSGPSSCWAKVE